MWIKRLCLLIYLLLAAMILVPAIHAQEKKVNQKKIDKDRARKQKQAQKDYHNAVKQHNKNQSKSTKEMMRQSRKQSGTLTPVKP
jgi:cell division protein FtsL